MNFLAISRARVSQQRHPRFSFMAAAWLCTLLSAATASAAPLRVLAVDEPPMAWLDEKGQVDGMGADFVRELQMRIDDHAVIELLPEPRALQAAQQQANVVLIGFSRTPEREPNFHWIAPLIRKPWVLYTRAGDVRRAHSLADLKQFNGIAVVRGDVRERWLRQQGAGNLVGAGTPGQGVRLLQAGRADAFFHEPQSVLWFCRAQGCGESPPVAAWVVRHSDVWLLMSKAGTAPALAQRWQQAAQQMRADGSYERIARLWSERGQREVGIASVWRKGLLEYCADRASCKP